MAIEAFDKMAREIEPPGQHEVDRSELHADRDIARAVGERAFLSPHLAMVVVKGDCFEGLRGDILGTERIVNAQKEQAPARALLNLGEGAQEEQREGALNGCTLPGARAEKVGEGEMVGVGHTQQAREGTQGLVLAGANQERLDAIEGVAELGS